MKAVFWVFSFSLLAVASSISWPSQAAAESAASACAIPAAKLLPDTQAVMASNPRSALLQRFARLRDYVGCLRSHGAQPASSPMAAAARRTYVTFDVPGGSLTDPTAINWVGTIVGYYFDPRFVPHSFVRYPGGALIPFDPPGATGGSVPFGIDPEGTIAGQSCDATTCHGFLRYAGGSFVTFDPPAATYTNPIAINAFGTIAGYYCDASACHGFLRDPAGAFVVFDPPGPIYTGEFAGGGANVIGVNAEGAITGAFCSDPNCNGQSGFVRTHSGAIATFDPQGSLATSPSDINVAGAIAGYYRDVNRVFHGFLRAPSGAIIAFDPPTSTIQTTACCITWTGTIVGSYIDPSSFDFHGYLRTWNGAFTVFDPPGSLATIPVAINAVGTVTGQFCDATTCHGFVRNR